MAAIFKYCSATSGLLTRPWCLITLGLPFNATLAACWNKVLQVKVPYKTCPELHSIPYLCTMGNLCELLLLKCSLLTLWSHLLGVFCRLIPLLIPFWKILEKKLRPCNRRKPFELLGKCTRKNLTFQDKGCYRWNRRFKKHIISSNRKIQVGRKTIIKMKKTFSCFSAMLLG